MIVDRIEHYLEHTLEGEPDAAELKRREGIMAEAAARWQAALMRQLAKPREERVFRISASNCGKCPKALSFKSHGAKEKPFNARTRANFMMGDAVEVQFYALARLAGADIGACNGEVKTICGRGFIDGLFHWAGGPDPFTGRELVAGYYVFECKSMSDAGFREFESTKDCFDDDTWGYVTQSRIYAQALDAVGTIMCGWRKATGHMHERIVTRDDAYVRTKLAVAEKACATEPKSLEPPTWATESLKHMPRAHVYEIEAPQCRYCDFVEACWPGVQTEILSKGPVYRIPEDALNPI